MKRDLIGLAVIIGLAAGAGCATDPTADLSDSGRNVQVQYSAVTLVAGDSLLVTAETKDGQDATVPDVPVAASVNPSVATVSDAYLPPLPIGRFYIKGVAAGTTQVNVTAAGAATAAAIDVIVN